MPHTFDDAAQRLGIGRNVMTKKLRDFVFGFIKQITREVQRNGFFCVDQ